MNMFIDEKLLVPDNSLSLAEGALVPWTKIKLSAYAGPWLDVICPSL